MKEKTIGGGATMCPICGKEGYIMDKYRVYRRLKKHDPGYRYVHHNNLHEVFTTAGMIIVNEQENCYVGLVEA